MPQADQEEQEEKIFKLARLSNSPHMIIFSPARRAEKQKQNFPDLVQAQLDEECRKLVDEVIKCHS